MAKICDVCGEEIKVYPCEPTTCGLCLYKRDAEAELVSLHQKLDEYFKGRIAEVYTPKYFEAKDRLFSSILEVIDKMKDEDAEAIEYIINNVKERW